MQKSKTATLILSVLITSVSYAKSPTAVWTSDVVEDYLNPKKGTTIETISDVENGSRWYLTGRVKGTVESIYGSDKVEKQTESIAPSFRLRGYTKLTDDIGFVGDLWLQAKEIYKEVDHKNKNNWNGFEDSSTVEQYRFGFESDKAGALYYGKYAATQGTFTTDMGVEGLYDVQGDAGGKSGEKVIYKSHFDNNMFTYASYDINSSIHGFDIGYQLADMYDFVPNGFGVYFSMHNGQPMLENGAGSFIIGNVDINSSADNSDTTYARAHENLYTYQLSGYKNFGVQHKIVGNIAYSPMDSGETKEAIAKRGYTTGGLGGSASIGYQYIPKGFKGFSPVLFFSHDQFGEAFTPEIQYWFKPSLRVWLAESIQSGGQDMTKLEFQWDF